MQNLRQSSIGVQHNPHGCSGCCLKGNAGSGAPDRVLPFLTSSQVSTMLLFPTPTPNSKQPDPEDWSTNEGDSKPSHPPNLPDLTMKHCIPTISLSIRVHPQPSYLHEGAWMQGALTQCLHTVHAEELQSILQKPLNPSKQVSKGSLYDYLWLLIKICFLLKVNFTQVASKLETLFISDI